MNYFLIAGNTRVGSTWLAASFNMLPDVACNKEIKWRLPYNADPPPPVHSYVTEATGSMIEQIRSTCAKFEDRQVAVGSKFKFDPYGYLSATTLDRLKQIVEPDIFVVHLRRSYFDIFQTWKSVGIRHLANPDADKSSVIDPEWVDRFIAHHSSPVIERCVILTMGGAPLAAPETGLETVYCAVEDAVEDMLVLFYNDLAALAAFAHVNQRTVVEYADIEAEFLRLANVIRPGIAKTEAESALRNGPTRQIEREGQLVFPDAGLRAISDYLDGMFRRAATGGGGERIMGEDGRGRPAFNLPELVDIVAAHPETKHLAARLGGQDRSQPARRLEHNKSQHWTSERPVYQPAGIDSAAPNPGPHPARQSLIY